MFGKRGQSTLEYVIVLTAIIAAVLIGVKYFTGTTGTHGSAAAGIGNLIDKSLSRMTNQTEKLPGATSKW